MVFTDQHAFRRTIQNMRVLDRSGGEDRRRMSPSLCGERFDIGLPNEIAGDPDEPVGVEVEREIAHAFLKGTPDDVYDGLRVAPCRVFDVEDVADAGIKQVVLPEKNRNDVDEIEADLLVGLDLAYVGTIDEALQHTLSAPT